MDLKNIVTPLNVEKFAELLKNSNYDRAESVFLIDGFTNGFDIGYKGPKIRQSRAKNIPFTVGDKFDLWRKIMKEVKAGRYAGPFNDIPFENYIQSPIGLVPKAGNKTRLIFHLSYQFPGDPEVAQNKSVNGSTPWEACSVHYNDLDHVIRNCILMSEKAEIINGHKVIYLGKTDLSSAFRVLPLKIQCFQWLVLMAQDPRDSLFKFFVDKCLPFGASISCLHYQRFSNALRHILEYQTDNIGKNAVTNYLDEILFIAILKYLCDGLITAFIDLCTQLNIPIAIEKTEWGTTMLEFLGILLDGRNLALSLPIEK